MAERSTPEMASRRASERWRYAPLDAGFAEQVSCAVADIVAGFRGYRSWRYLAVESLKNQYRRTVLGPWWLTVQTALYIVGLALIFGQLLGAGLRSFVPYVALGFVTFVLLQGLTVSASQVFVASPGRLKSIRQPMTSIVLHDAAVVFIQFGHNLVIFAVFFATGQMQAKPQALLALPVIACIAINGVALGLWLGPLVARFRDVGPAVLSVLQVMIFFTPVFYKRSALHGAQANLVAWNPFTYLIDAFRLPLLGVRLHPGDFVGAGVVTVVNLALGLWVFSRYRSRVPYWVS